MSKKIKFLIIMISLAIIIGLIFGIMAIYRFYVIQSIFKKIDENIEIKNYSLKTTLTNSKGEKTVTQVYYKDGIGKNIASNGVYTWVDEKDAYMVDEANNKLYVLDIEGENADGKALVGDYKYEGKDKETVVDELASLAQAGLDVRRLMVNNPRVMTLDEAIAIYKEAL